MFCYSVDAHIEKKNNRTDNVLLTRVGEKKTRTYGLTLYSRKKLKRLNKLILKC